MDSTLLASAGAPHGVAPAGSAVAALLFAVGSAGGRLPRPAADASVDPRARERLPADVRRGRASRRPLAGHRAGEDAGAPGDELLITSERARGAQSVVAGIEPAGKDYSVEAGYLSQ